MHFFAHQPFPVLSMLDLVKEFRGILGMLRNPESTESVFDIEDGLRKAEATSLSIKHILACPDMGPLVRDRYLRGGVPDLEALGQLPQGTLGRGYADHLISHNFDPDYFRKIEVTDDESYCIMRIRETHDIWHVVCGFSPSPLGEIGIKAVELAQMRRPMAAVICCGAVFRYMMRDPDQLGHVLRAISTGYQLGLHAQKLLAQRWEDMWERPLAEIQAELGVVPATAEISDPPFVGPGEDADPTSPQDLN